MAPHPIIKKSLPFKQRPVLKYVCSCSGFTLIESVLVISIFMILIFIATQIYFNLMDSLVQAQHLQLALDNVRFGSERVWNEIKLGSDFVVAHNGNEIRFKDRNCQNIEIEVQGHKLVIITFNNISVPLFDEKLVKVNDFKIYSDQPSGGYYYQTTYKLFQIHYDLTLKTPRGEFPLKFWQTVAPLNSVFVNPPCW